MEGWDMGGHKDLSDLQYRLERLDYEIELFGRALIGDDPHGSYHRHYKKIAREMEEVQRYVADYFERNMRHYLGRDVEAGRSLEPMEVIGGQLQELNGRLNEFSHTVFGAGEWRLKRWTDNLFKSGEGPALFAYVTMLEQLRQLIWTIIGQLESLTGHVASALPRSSRVARTEADRGESAAARTSIAVYLATDDPQLQQRALAAVDRLVDALGYEPNDSAVVERSSIFKRWWARVKTGLTSPEVQQRLAKVEAYAESYLNERVGENNLNEARALSEVLGALNDIPHACMRIGSLLLVKHTGLDGPVVLTRSLSPLEIRILEKFPEILKDPLTVLDLLANALAFKEDHLALDPPGYEP
jgi:hypothetical protein